MPRSPHCVRDRHLLTAPLLDPLTHEPYAAVLDRLWPQPVRPDPEQITDAVAFDEARARYEKERDRWHARRERLKQKLEKPHQTHGGSGGTWWAGLNAITEYAQHEAVRGDADVSLLFGQSGKLTRAATQLVLEEALA
jgi:hypothetical protein